MRVRWVQWVQWTEITGRCEGGSTGVSVTTTVAPGGFAEEVIAWHWTVEEETSRCMAERGFEYVAYVPRVTIDNLRGMYDENRIEV